ncbi:MAG: sigma-70 family RNA polymerase sigma factor [Candidatus Eiseniibacteriota bacterium]
MDARDPAHFHAQFTTLFDARFPGLFRYLNRLAGEPELAADVAQEAFVRLYRRGSFPDAPEAWLVTVAMNLLRNELSSRSRRSRLLGPVRGENVLGDPPPPPGVSEAHESTRRRVRSVLDHLSERDRSLLLLRAEGWSYREIATALGLRETSVGVLLARARQAFRKAYGSTPPSTARECEESPNAD